MNFKRPEKLYRYAKLQYNNDALAKGKFLLRPASFHKRAESNAARKDDELQKKRSLNIDHVEKILPDGSKAKIKIIPGSAQSIHTSLVDYFILCFSLVFEPQLFEEFESDSCLIIHKPEDFAERLHSAYEKRFKVHSGIDHAVNYKIFDKALGVPFYKEARYSYQQEYRFAWREPKWAIALTSLGLLKKDFGKVSCGSIEDIAEIKQK